MTHTRIAIATITLCGALLAACGGSSSSTTQAPSASAPAAASASATASSSDSGSSATDPSNLVLSTDALPSSDATWTVQTDGTLSGQSGSHQRVWKSSDGNQGLEIDVWVQDSSSAAEQGWSQWRDGVMGKVTGTPGSCPSGAPSNCAEVSGTWQADGSSQAVVLAWQQNSVLAAVLLVGQNGTTRSQSFAEQVSSAEGSQISNA